LRAVFTSLTLFLLFVSSSVPIERTADFMEKPPCEITLSSLDDICGEWGGNLQIVRLFKKDCEGHYFIEYKLRTMDCESDPIIHYKRSDFDKTKVVVATTADENLLWNCITELKEMSDSNPNFITHSGILNRAISSDSTINLRDYPSKNWRAFELLKESILER